VQEFNKKRAKAEVKAPSVSMVQIEEEDNNSGCASGHAIREVDSVNSNPIEDRS